MEGQVRNHFIGKHKTSQKLGIVFFVGTGKSATIEVIAMQAEKILRAEGDKPNHPRVLLLAQTGKAASLIGNLINCSAPDDLIIKYHSLRWYYYPWGI